MAIILFIFLNRFDSFIVIIRKNSKLWLEGLDSCIFNDNFFWDSRSSKLIFHKFSILPMILNFFIKGDVPQWRDFHTTCIIDNCMYVFGGRSDQMFEFQTSSDVYCDKLKMLDLRTNIWSELKVSGVQPCGRRSHTACTTMFTVFI